jgi:hypothetical protein
VGGDNTHLIFVGGDNSHLILGAKKEGTAKRPLSSFIELPIIALLTNFIELPIIALLTNLY